MTQEICHDFPPLYDEIALAFNLHPCDPIIFSWGGRIYNPDGEVIPPELMDHEAIHGERQVEGPCHAEMNIRDWWRRYIEDTIFRLKDVDNG